MALFRLSLVLCANLVEGVSLSSRRADACECMNWKEAYASHPCGAGLEMTGWLDPDRKAASMDEFLKSVESAAERKQLEHTLYGWQWYKTDPAHPNTFHSFEGHTWDDDICEGAYKKLDTAMCVKASMGLLSSDWHGQTWCYVTEDCSSATPVYNCDEGDCATTGLAVKLCEEGKDAMMMDVPLNESTRIAEKWGINRGSFRYLAYPFYDIDCPHRRREDIERITRMQKVNFCQTTDRWEDAMTHHDFVDAYNGTEYYRWVANGSFYQRYINGLPEGSMPDPTLTKWERIAIAP